MHMTKATSQPESYVLYDSLYMTFWKRQNCGDSKKINDFQRLEKDSND